MSCKDNNNDSWTTEDSDSSSDFPCECTCRCQQIRDLDNDSNLDSSFDSDTSWDDDGSDVSSSEADEKKNCFISMYKNDNKTIYISNLKQMKDYRKKVALSDKSKKKVTSLWDEVKVKIPLSGEIAFKDIFGLNSGKVDESKKVSIKTKIPDKLSLEINTVKSQQINGIHLPAKQSLTSKPVNLSSKSSENEKLRKNYFENIKISLKESNTSTAQKTNVTGKSNVKSLIESNKLNDVTKSKISSSALNPNKIISKDSQSTTKKSNTQNEINTNKKISKNEIDNNIQNKASLKSAVSKNVQDKVIEPNLQKKTITLKNLKNNIKDENSEIKPTNCDSTKNIEATNNNAAKINKKTSVSKSIESDSKKQVNQEFINKATEQYLQTTSQASIVLKNNKSSKNDKMNSTKTISPAVGDLQANNTNKNNSSHKNQSNINNEINEVIKVDSGQNNIQISKKNKKKKKQKEKELISQDSSKSCSRDESLSSIKCERNETISFEQIKKGLQKAELQDEKNAINMVKESKPVLKPAFKLPETKNISQNDLKNEIQDSNKNIKKIQKGKRAQRNASSSSHSRDRTSKKETNNVKAATKKIDSSQKDTNVGKFESESDESKSKSENSSNEDIDLLNNDDQMPTFIAEAIKRKHANTNRLKNIKNEKTVKAKSEPVVKQVVNCYSDDLKKNKYPAHNVEATDKLSSCQLGEEAIEMIMEERFSDALNNFVKAISLNRDDHRHYLNRSYCYLRMSKNDLALTEARNVLKSSTNIGHLFIANFRAGQACYALKKFKQAEDFLEKAKSINPTSHYALREYRRAQIRQIIEVGYKKRDAIYALRDSDSTLEALEYLKSYCYPKYDLNDNDEEDKEYSSDFDEKPDNIQILNDMVKYVPCKTKLLHLVSKPIDPKYLVSKSVTNNEVMSIKSVQQSPAINPSAIWVGSLTMKMTNNMLEDTFNQYGKVVSVYRPAEAAFAFVNFEKKDPVEKILSKIEPIKIAGSPICIKPAQKTK